MNHFVGVELRDLQRSLKRLQFEVEDLSNEVAILTERVEKLDITDETDNVIDEIIRFLNLQFEAQIMPLNRRSK